LLTVKYLSHILILICIILSIRCTKSAKVEHYSTPKQKGSVSAHRTAGTIDNKHSLIYDAPSNWQAVPPANSFHFASFDLKNGIHCSISIVGGTILQNINRWRRQLSLMPINKPKNDNAFNGLLGKFNFIQISNNGRFIWVAVCPYESMNLFVKLTGTNPIGSRIQKEFVNFCKSITKREP